MVRKVVSGGQTGVDQAGLRMASDKGLEVGGWCPKGGLDEDGNNILDKYPLQEAGTKIPAERTKLNVRDSDGTLVIVPRWPIPEIPDGTQLTIDEAEHLSKPLLVISLEHKHLAVETIQKWLDKYDIKVLNIAGPRESSCKGIHAESCKIFEDLFDNCLRPTAWL